MSLSSVHVEAWMRGKQMEMELEPFQRLVFQFHSMISANGSSKQTMQQAVDAFRHKYYNKFLFDLQKHPIQQSHAFVKRFKQLDELKKPSKKDFETLVSDLCGFKSQEWHGGHCCGVPVLSEWKPNISECPPLHTKWYKDEVERLRDQHKLKKNTCAVCLAKFLWKDFIGPVCPANVRVVCDHCEPNESVQKYLQSCQNYALTPRATIDHVTQTFLHMYDEIALRPEHSVEEQLHDLYKKRIPACFNDVAAKETMRKELDHYRQRCVTLEGDLSDATTRADNNNALFKECSVSLDAISDRLSRVEDTLRQYQLALRERDDIIRGLSRTNQSIYNRRY